MIELRGLTKRYRARVAVDRLTVTVEPGRVTGFLGPNGSGKTTTIRCALGLARPTAGTATVRGRAYRDLAHPLREVGALVDPRARHPGRTAHAHLLALARGNGLPVHRVDDVIELVGLTPVAHERVRGFSLGMAQRLGIAAALLGDPEVLLLDEPVNGLDPEGIRWVRELLRDLADEGRTVLVSSHLMSEMQETADHLVVLGRGRLLADVPMADLLGAHTAVRVRSPQAPVLASAVQRAGGHVELEIDGALRIDGLAAADVGDLAHGIGVRLHELSPVTGSLEDAYLALTGDDVEYGAVAP
ncbi:ATP-binding cassette domain-containing protein [Blastococcus sp. MG754426]|uniref:ATP-binding cassette domain-containing protein n=1 Tax=unclassified Blastococcus TaxID=2619396 RepID=UPI001EF1404B|nr:MULTISPECIES: ATP-binding cassette domain-containing protein [unclassified Blastococcus]MCF6507346.1 ATP-binding cassette domain-containing protein [Blastococcus sp. MG754426]MCF6511418.1 ATP-binding cassette domain-containing protein [Blastococcus sp. MG754427]